MEMRFKSASEAEAVTGHRREINFKAGTRRLAKRHYSRRLRRKKRRELAVEVNNGCTT